MEDIQIIFNGMVQSGVVDSVRLDLGDAVLDSSWSSRRVYSNKPPVHLLFGSKENVKRGQRTARWLANVDGEPYRSRKPFQVELPEAKP